MPEAHTIAGAAATWAVLVMLVISVFLSDYLERELSRRSASSRMTGREEERDEEVLLRIREQRRLEMRWRLERRALEVRDE